MKTVVTGGAGFIGSHLCEYLLGKGCEVICIDNYLTGKEDNISSLKENNNFELLVKNILEPLELECDSIYHLASPASPVDYQELPIDTLMVNSIGTKNMVDLAVKNEAKFLLASTSEVYGDPKEHPQKETYWGNVNPVGPRSCYDESKRFAEALTMAYIRKKNLDARIIRIFNTYGPRMREDDGRIFPNFITQALANKPITVYGDGKQTRSFCYASDLVKGIYKAMNTPNTSGGVFNLGSPNEITVLEIASMIKELINSKSEIVFKELPVDDPKRRRPDISKARKLLNWEPNVDLKEGIERTVEWFRK